MDKLEGTYIVHAMLPVISSQSLACGHACTP